MPLLMDDAAAALSREILFSALADDAMPDALFIHDDEGRLLEVNRQACESLGYSRAELLVLTVAGIEQDFDLAAARTAWGRLERGGRHRRHCRHRRKDGSVFPVENRCGLTEIGGRRLYVCVARDITEHRTTERNLRLAALVYENTSEAMLVTDPDGVIVSVNSAFTRITGYEPEEVAGKSPRLLQSGRHGRAFYEAMWASIRGTGRWQGEIWNRRKTGEVFPEWLSIDSLYNDDGTVFRRIGLFSDISERKDFQKAIWKQANYDALTALPNRSMFLDRLHLESGRSRRTGQPTALLLIDLDLFREVNDSLGFRMGDALLKLVASRLRSAVRETDMVARLGGDEFAVVLAGMPDRGSVEGVAGLILEKMTAPCILDGEQVFVSASIGITLCPDDAAEAEALVRNADQAMYESKRLGRNRFNFFQPAMQESALKWVRLVNELRVAIAEGQFELFYQPIVELATGAIRKAEALIRWRHPSRGIVGPAEFIPIAEQTGLIVEIGDWVFREAVSQAARWSGLPQGPVQISINKSPVQFREERNAHGAWTAYLCERGLSRESLAVEITEGILMDDSEGTINQLLALRDAGIEIALDDFGTGYSALSYLKKFDIDSIKIDRSFIRDMVSDSHDRALCEAIIAMAHKLGMKVIAEGVETSGQRDLLLAAGCDYGQGYLFSKPLPAADLESLLKGR